MPWLYFFFKISLQVFVKMDCKNHEGLLAATDLIGLDKRHSYSTHFKFWVSRDPPRPTPPLHMIVKILKDHHICNILGASPENACESNHFQKVNKNLTHHRMQQHFHTGKTIPRAFCTKKNLLCCLCSKKPTHLNVFWKGFWRLNIIKYSLFIFLLHLICIFCGFWTLENALWWGILAFGWKTFVNITYCDWELTLTYGPFVNISC